MKIQYQLLLAASLALGASQSLSAAEPRELWDKHCASCHGKDGKGQTKMGKKLEVRDYSDAKVLDSIKDDKAFTAIKDGLNENGKERMKPFKDKLSDDEIKALLKFVRTLKG